MSLFRPSQPSFRLVLRSLIAALVLLTSLPASAANAHRSVDELMSLCSANPMQAKIAGASWLAEATAAGRVDEQIQALLVLVEAEGRLEQPAEMAPHADQGLALARRAGDRGAEARFLSSRAYAADLLGEKDQSWPLLQQALQLAQSQQDPLVKGMIFGTYGTAALWRGKIEEAQTYLTRSVEIFQKNGPADRLAIALMKLNDLHQVLGDSRQALRDVEEARSTLVPGRYPYLESIVVYNLGVNHLRVRHFDKAREQFERALVLSIQLKDQQGLAFAYQRLAMVAVEQDMPRKAEQYARLALKVFDASGNQLLKLLTRLTLADALTHAKDRRALQVIEEARPLLTAQDEDSQVRFHAQAGRTQAQFGDYAKAYDNMLAAYTRSSELARKQDNERVHEQQARFDTQRKEMDNVLLRKEQTLQQMRLTRSSEALQRRGLMLTVLLLVLCIIAYALLLQFRGRRKLTKFALRDELTGLPNRRSITLYAKRQLAVARSRKRPICLAIADIDHFKRINDTYGHAIGDNVLRAIFSECVPQLQRTDRLGRIGGEEFLLVLPGATPASLPGLFRCLQDASAGTHIEGLPKGYPLSFSLGAVFVAGDSRAEHDLATLLARADAALYRAKDAGRNCLRMADADDVDEPENSAEARPNDAP